jgi:hypothetical protein
MNILLSSARPLTSFSPQRRKEREEAYQQEHSNGFAFFAVNNPGLD